MPLLGWSVPYSAFARLNFASATLCFASPVLHFALLRRCYTLLCFAGATLCSASPVLHLALLCLRVTKPCIAPAVLYRAIPLLVPDLALLVLARLCLCSGLLPYQQNAFMAVGMAVLYRRRISPFPAFPASLLECTATAPVKAFFKFVLPAVEDSLHTDSSSHLNLP